MRMYVGLGALALAVALPSAASAVALLDLYNTGVDGAGVKTGLGQLETHWYISGGGTATTYNNAAYIVDPDANFISAGVPAGVTATYSLNFDLSGYDFNTASISGNSRSITARPFS